MDEALTPEVLTIARIIAAARTVPVPVRTAPYRVREAAAVLGVHPATLYREIHRGNCKARRMGVGRGTYRITPAQLADYQRKTETDAAAPPAPDLRVVTG